MSESEYVPMVEVIYHVASYRCLVPVSRYTDPDIEDETISLNEAFEIEDERSEESLAEALSNGALEITTEVHFVSITKDEATKHGYRV